MIRICISFISDTGYTRFKHVSGIETRTPVTPVADIGNASPFRTVQDANLPDNPP